MALSAAGRVGAGRLICLEGCTAMKINVTYGVGAGFLFRMNHRLTADLGADYIRVIKWGSSGNVMLRAGFGIGL